MPGTLGKELQQQVIENVLSPHEQNLLRLAGQGKSPDAIAKLYRQYEGENGVIEALAAIREKVEGAARRRVERTTAPSVERPLKEHLSEMASGIEPAGANGSMNGAGAAPEAARVAATPPNGTAPAVDTGPSRNGSTPAVKAPAGGKVRASVAQAQERDARVVVLLSVRRMTPKAIAAVLSCPLSQVVSGFERLQEAGVAMRTADSAYDWPDAVRRGRPGRVWRLVEEPDGCERAADVPEPARAGSEKSRSGPQLGGNSTGISADSPAEFDARALWDGWSELQRMQMTRVVLNALLGRVE